MDGTDLRLEEIQDVIKGFEGYRRPTQKAEEKVKRSESKVTRPP